MQQVQHSLAAAAFEAPVVYKHEICFGIKAEWRHGLVEPCTVYTRVSEYTESEWIQGLVTVHSLPKVSAQQL